MKNRVIKCATCKLVISLVFLLISTDYGCAQIDTSYIANAGLRYVFMKQDTSSDYEYRVHVYEGSNLISEFSTDQIYSANERIITYGLYKGYYESGEVRFLGYANKGLHGVVSFYYKGGDLRSQTTFEHGEKKGLNIDYYPSGRVASVGEFDYKFYNPKTSPAVSKKGVWRYYHENGELKAMGSYYFEEIVLKGDDYKEPPLAVGEARALHPWIVNVKDGGWEYWNEEGERVKVEDYFRGDLMMVNEYKSSEK